MQTSEIISFIILLVISISCFIVSGFQFKEKGFLFNNAYLYASKKERESMNKKPHYRQSAIVFTLIGIIFLINAIKITVNSEWLFWGSMLCVAIVIVYAIISTIHIEKKNY